MFTILNRLRGTESYFAKVAAVALGAVLYLITRDPLLAILVTVGYIAGESFGWGKWIAGIIQYRKGPATQADIANTEGHKYGIHQIANKIAPETKDFYRYCVVALAIRGIYWWAPVMAPLAILGYVPIHLAIYDALALGIMFPAAFIAARKTKDLFKIDTKLFKVQTHWHHGELVYGFWQDAIFAWIIFSHLI